MNEKKHVIALLIFLGGGLFVIIGMRVLSSGSYFIDALMIPIVSVSTIMLTVPYLSDILFKFHNSIQQGLVDEFKDIGSRSFRLFFLWGILFSFSIASLFYLYSTEWIIQNFILITPDIEEDLLKWINEMHKTSDYSFVILNLIILSSGFLVMITYRTMYIKKRNEMMSKDEKTQTKSLKKKAGGLSYLILFTSILGIIVYLYTWITAKVESLEPYLQILFILLPLLVFIMGSITASTAFALERIEMSNSKN